MDEANNGFIDPGVYEYASLHSSPESELLQGLRRATHLRTPVPHMLCSHVQGALLYHIARMCQPRMVLEVGTFTGYSAICMASALPEGGKLITIEANAEVEEIARSFFEKAGLSHTISLLVGDAIDIVPGLSDTFDLVYIDAGKESYKQLFQIVSGKVRPGGYILLDNTLFYGTVMECTEEGGPKSGLGQFNQWLAGQSGFETLLLPLADGLTVVRKM